MLLTLSDEAFFELMRNYLGEIRTPFNKHDLINRLTAFLKREDTIERIIGMIDADEARVLTIIRALGEPTHERLFYVLGGKHSYLELHRMLVNLEDRLLVYRDNSHIRFVPELLPPLEEHILDTERIIPSSPLDGASVEPWLDDNLVASLFAFFRQIPSPVKSDGTLRKRTAELLADRAPTVAQSPERVAAAVNVMRYLRAIGDADSRGEVMRQLVAASREARQALYAAAAIADEEAQVPRLQRGMLELAAALDPERAYSAEATALLVRLADSEWPIDPSLVVERLSAADLLVTVGDRLALPCSESRNDTTVVIQPNMEITLAPDVSFDDKMFIASTARLIRHDRYPHFELTKESVAERHEEGGSAEKIASRLARLAATVPQNVRVSLEAWSTEFESIQLARGVVLTVSPERRALIEHAESVKRLVRRVLAPGIYLLDEADVEELTEALHASGIEVPPRLPPARTPATQLPPLAERSGTGAALKIMGQAPRGDRKVGSNADSVHTELRGHLDRLTLPNEQRRELEARIARKLILFPEQLRPGAVRDRKSEAKGLDYVGKVRLIEQAIRSNGDFLEVVVRQPDGSPRKLLVQPRKLEARSDQLFLTAGELPSDAEISIPVSKISVVRALRGTLYNR